MSHVGSGYPTFISPRRSEYLSSLQVAEGIENEEQRRFLIEQGCAAGQGFLFSPPLPAGDLEEWLRARG